jgi:hypothetical protein
MIERDTNSIEHSYCVKTPGAGNLFAQVSFPKAGVPNLETDPIAITIQDPANPSLALRRVCVQGKVGLLEWLRQNTKTALELSLETSLQTIDLVECVASYLIANVNDSLARSQDAIEIRQFQSMVRAFLKARYGVDLNHTHLHDPAVVADCIRKGFSASDVVEEHAQEAGLIRLHDWPQQPGALPKMRA